MMGVLSGDDPEAHREANDAYFGWPPDFEDATDAPDRDGEEDDDGDD